MDLMNLSQELKQGKRIPQDDGRVVIMTPLGRVDFPALKTPDKGPNDQAAPKWGLRLIWNWNDQSQPAHIDINAVLLPAIGEVAKAAGMSPKGHLRAGNEPKMERDDGTWAEGYGPGFVFASLNTFAFSKSGDPRPAPPVYDARRQQLDAALVKAGYYARAVCAVYSTRQGGGKICFGLEGVQLIAKGELLGGGMRRDYSSEFGDVQGDTFEHEQPNPFPPDGGAEGGYDGYGGPDDIPF